MIFWKNALGAEIIKLKKSCFFWVHMLVPLVGAIIVMLYYHLSSQTIEFKFMMYMTMVAAAFPFMIALVTAISFQREEENNFYLLLSVTNRNAILLAKLTILFTMGCFSTLLALALFPVLIGKCYSVTLFLQLFIMICVSNVILYMVHSFWCLCFGKIVSIFGGICETLIALVFLTGLGDVIWKYVPCSMGTRGSNMLILLADENLSSYAEIKSVYLAELNVLPVIGIIEIIIVLTLFLAWFQKWEGRKVYE